MSFLEKSFNILKKIGIIIERVFIAIILILLAVIIISNIAVLIFIGIRNTTGYCNSFMTATIEKVSDINWHALKLWADDC